MTRDEIVEIGRQAGMDYIEYISDESMKQVEKFIGLIEAKEREACAKIAETPVGEYEVIVACGSEPTPHRIPRYLDSMGLAEAIRARGEA